jgi:putative ABC transport system permease protein
MMFGGATLMTPLTVGPWEHVARPFTRAIFGGEGRLGGSNIQRAKMRTTLTVTALMVGIGMMLSVQAMTEAFQKDLGEWVDGYMGGDLYVYSALPMRPEFAGRLEALEGVEAVAGSRYLYVTVKRPDGRDETVALHVVDPPKYERVGSFTFASSTEDPQAAMQRLAEGDAVFLSSLIADRYALGEGDTLQIQTRRGLRDFEVAGVVIDFYDQGMVIEGSWRDMRQYFRVNDVAAFQVKVAEGHSPDAVRETIEAIYGTRRNLASFSNEALKAVALGISAQAFALFDVLSWIAVVVASLGVVNTLMMNVLERTREIGMLRGVGMTRWQVVKMILAEAGVMGVIGGVLGIVVGLFLARVLIVSTNAMQGYSLEYVIPTQGLAVAFVIALAISQLAALWPSGRAARLAVIEAIQFE